MKKSNILLIVSVVILLGALTGYNIALKNQYLSGAHKVPYQNFEALKLQAFDAVAVNAGSEIGVKIEAGKESKVLVTKDDLEYIKVKVVNGTLVIDVAYENERRNYDGRERVIVTVPTLKAVTTDSKYTVDGKSFTFGRGDSKKPEYKGWANGYTTITGFNQDSLIINQDNNSEIFLKRNKLGSLRAITGKSAGSISSLSIEKDNTIAAANLDIRNKSTLTLENIKIPKLGYQFSDSATVNFSGAALAILKK